MESEPLTLLLAGISTAEIDFATALISDNSLKLADHSNLLLRLHSAEPTPDDTPSFDVLRYFDSLSTTRFGRFLLWSPRLPSTHDVVSQKIPTGAVCVADVQYKGRVECYGLVKLYLRLLKLEHHIIEANNFQYEDHNHTKERGRSTNIWESPTGCLMFSFTFQMEEGLIFPLVSYVASLALTEAIKDLCDKNGLPQLEVKIMWPGDLYLNGLKVGSILCTATYQSKKFDICLGICVNVDNRRPTTCLNERLQELTSEGFQLRREDILGSFFRKFETFFDILTTQGFHPMEELYYETWLHSICCFVSQLGVSQPYSCSGQRVIIQDTCDGQKVDSVFTIQGLTQTGYLMALGDDGQLCELHPDGNSLDFFKGLIRHKLG